MQLINNFSWKVGFYNLSSFQHLKHRGDTDSLIRQDERGFVVYLLLLKETTVPVEKALVLSEVRISESTPPPQGRAMRYGCGAVLNNEGKTEFSFVEEDPDP